MNALNGYQQLRAEKVVDDGYCLLSMGAGGALLFLRLKADESRFVARIAGAIQGERDLWTAEDAILAIAEREEMAGEQGGADQAMAQAGKWVYDLRDAGFVAFGTPQAIIIVEDYLRDMGRAARNRPDFATVTPGRREYRLGGVEGRGEAPGLRVAASREMAGRSRPPVSSPPPAMGAFGDGEDMAEAMGGKGGVYSEVTEFKANQTKPQTKVQTQTPNQRRADAMGAGGGDDTGGRSFHSRIWDADIVSAAMFACDQRGKVFENAVMKRVNQYGVACVRQACEYVAEQMRDQRHTIKARDQNGQIIGGPLLWAKIDQIARARLGENAVKSAIGFQGGAS